MTTIPTIEPVRIQLRRIPGWRLQAHSQAINGLPAIKVDRSGPWGNPFPVRATKRIHPLEHGITAEQAVARYIGWLDEQLRTRAIDLAPLRAHNLACWCRLCPDHQQGKPLGVECQACAPCHVNPLLIAANPDLGAILIRAVREYFEDTGHA